MRINKKFQVTIPAHIRKLYGFLPGSEVELVDIDGQVVLKKPDSSFEKLRGFAKGQFSTADILRKTRNY